MWEGRKKGRRRKILERIEKLGVNYEGKSGTELLREREKHRRNSISKKCRGESRGSGIQPLTGCAGTKGRIRV